MFKAPAIYFPSTVVLLDDDSLYAKMLIERMQTNNIHYLESHEYLSAQKNCDLLFSENQNGDITSLKWQLDKIKHTGSLISVIVSDLFMQDFTGIELFESIKSPHVGRILISNFIDYNKDSDVANARNNGLIDIVLDKTKCLHERLPQAILAAKIKFFTAISNLLFSDSDPDHPLSDTEFAKFYIDKITALNPKEIIPSSTFSRFTFKFNDSTTDLSLHVISKKETNDLLLTDAAESAPKEVLKHLSSGKYILCNEEKDDSVPDGKLWPLYIRPAKQLNTNSNQFLYALTEAENVDLQ